MVETIFPREDLVILSGISKAYECQSEGSGKIIHIHFYEDCGTMLFIICERLDDIYGVFSGPFDDPHRSPRPKEKANNFYIG